MTLLTGLPRALDLAQTDLAATQARLPTVYDEAYLLATPDRDRPTPARQPNADPDFVKGEKWDCGLASYPAREAWSKMVAHLDVAETLAVMSLGKLSHRPPIVHVAHERRLESSLSDAQLLLVQRSIKRLAARLRGLQRLHAGLIPNEPDARQLAADLMGLRSRPSGSICDHVKLARWQAESIVAIVGTGKRPPPCKECRNPNSIGLREKGWRCHACAMRAYRAGSRQRRAAVRGWQASA